MADSLFKGPDQIGFGRELHKEIQKRTETKPGEALTKIVKKLSLGKGAELGRNMSRIQTNLEDEQAQLKTFATQATKHNKLIDELTTKGAGSLEDGLLRDELEKGQVKAYTGFAGLEASGNEELYSKMKEVVGEKLDYLNTKTKIFNRLYTKYDKDDVEGGILYDNISDDNMFTKPYRESLYNIAIDQKDLGNNNLLDVVTRKEQRNNFDLMGKYLDEEARLQAIISATSQARKAIKEVAIDYNIEEYLQPTDEGGGSKAARNKGKIEEKFNEFLSNSTIYFKNRNRGEDGAAYFFPEIGDDVKQLRSKYPYNDDLEAFKNEFGYTDKDIKDIFYDASIIINELENKQAVMYLDDNHPHLRLTGENNDSLRLSKVTQIFRDADYDIDNVPPEIRQQVIALKELPGYEESLVKIDDLLAYTQTIENSISNNAGKFYQELYSKLSDEVKWHFNTSVLSSAQHYAAKEKISIEEGITIAVFNQRLGLIDTSLPTSASNGEKIKEYLMGNKNEYHYQVRLPWKNNTLHQDILLDFPETSVISDSVFESYLAQINRNKIYWYNNETLLVSDPDYWEDGTQFSIGKYIVEFNSEADADGNRFIVTTQ